MKHCSNINDLIVANFSELANTTGRDLQDVLDELKDR